MKTMKNELTKEGPEIVSNMIQKYISCFEIETNFFTKRKVMQNINDVFEDKYKKKNQRR